jgi:hypothetical protein
MFATSTGILMALFFNSRGGACDNSRNIETGTTDEMINLVKYQVPDPGQTAQPVAEVNYKLIV